MRKDRLTRDQNTVAVHVLKHRLVNSSRMRMCVLHLSFSDIHVCVFKNMHYVHKQELISQPLPGCTHRVLLAKLRTRNGAHGRPSTATFIYHGCSVFLRVHITTEPLDISFFFPFEICTVRS
jgi:hypothetical protein